MATWIVHLRIAENLLNQIRGLIPTSFSIGNIAPDSGIPDEKWEHFDPPPEITHFQNSSSPNRDLDDFDFFRRYLIPLRSPPFDPEQFSFRLGYFFHLVTDNLWSREIGRPTHQRFADQFKSDPGFIQEVKGDWYGLDFVYLREHPECIFWKTFLSARIDRTGLDFLPIEALQARIAYIRNYYQRQDDEVQALMQRPFIYLSRDEMNRFVRTASNYLVKIYRQIWEDSVDLAAARSVLEMV